MPIPVRAQHRLLLVAGLAVVAAWVSAGLLAGPERELHARYARWLAGPSETQAALLVAIDEAALREPGLRARLEPAIAAGSPRLVIWPAPAVSWPEGQVGDPGYTVAGAGGRGVDPLIGASLVRAAEPEFPAPVLTALGLPARAGPLPTRYVAQLPTVAALRSWADAPGSSASATAGNRLLKSGSWARSALRRRSARCARSNFGTGCMCAARRPSPT